MEASKWRFKIAAAFQSSFLKKKVKKDFSFFFLQNKEVQNVNLLPVLNVPAFIYLAH